MTIPELSKRIGIEASVIRRWLISGSKPIHATKHGRDWWIEEDKALAKFIASFEKSKKGRPRKETE
jgi:predicted site-specific integrase-resolvase